MPSRYRSAVVDTQITHSLGVVPMYMWLPCICGRVCECESTYISCELDRRGQTGCYFQVSTLHHVRLSFVSSLSYFLFINRFVGKVNRLMLNIRLIDNIRYSNRILFCKILKRRHFKCFCYTLNLVLKYCDDVLVKRFYYKTCNKTCVGKMVRSFFYLP